MPSKFKYDILATVNTDTGVKVSKFVSCNSGMTVCIAELNGPTVSGSFTFATEVFNDDGLPHILERLVFFGSEKYPYKGVLNMIANRCFAQGTSSSTATDHTAYTVTTAGDEGFLKILPVFLDHLLFPTLTDAAFTTEVHHINGEGENAGVMYCEISDSECEESHCWRAMIHALYSGHCGYKSNTEGLIKNLRESTTIEKVRAYHKEFYRPENLCCIITGQIKAEDVFEALIPVEERILQEGKRRKFVRPWQTPVSPLLESITIEVEYPAVEGIWFDYGMIMAAFHGPLCNDFITTNAMSILLEYLTVAPMNREFVKNDQPLYKMVDHFILENSTTCLYLHFIGVPILRLKELKEKIFILLKGIIDGQEELNMEHIATLIKKKKLDILSSEEDYPHCHISFKLINDFIYGSSLDDLEHRVREIPTIEKLLEKDTQYWVDLIKTYMLDGNHVIVLGTPSSKLSDQMSNDEKNRIKLQQEKLGPLGLKAKANILDKAIKLNEVQAPKELLRSFTVPSVESIKFHPIKRICNVQKSNDVPYFVGAVPCHFQVDCVNTSFVRLFVLIDTSDLSLELRMYLPLLTELLDKCAIKRNGEIVPYQDVCKELAEDIISMSVSLGIGYQMNYAQILFLNLVVEEEKYLRSVQWIQEILYMICFESSQIKSTINKMVSNMSTERKTCGAESMMKNLCYQQDSNHWTADVFRQHAFLTKLQEQLDINLDEIVSKLNDIRHSIIQPNNMVIHLALNLDSLMKKFEPEKAWLQGFLPSTVFPAVLKSNFKKSSEYIQPHTDTETKGLIAGPSSVDSSYLVQTTVCSIKNISDYASLLVLIHYIDQYEDLKLHQAQGCSFYNYRIFVNYDSGIIYFKLYESTDLVKEYKETINHINSFLNGTTKWDMELLESACSSVIFELSNKIETIAGTISMSLQAFCRDPNVDAICELRELLQKVSKTTTTNLEHAGMHYLKPLFHPELSRCIVTCSPSQVNKIAEEFKKLSRELTVVPSLDDYFICKY